MYKKEEEEDVDDSDDDDEADYVNNGSNSKQKGEEDQEWGVGERGREETPIKKTKTEKKKRDLNTKLVGGKSALEFGIEEFG